MPEWIVWLVGPNGLLIGALLVVGVLWKMYLDAAHREREAAEKRSGEQLADVLFWKNLSLELIRTIPTFPGAIEKLTAAVQELDRRRAEGTAAGVEQVVERLVKEIRASRRP